MPNEGEYLTAVLKEAVRATGAQAAAVWSVVDGSFRLEHEVGLVDCGLAAESMVQALHEEAMCHILGGGSAAAPIVLTRELSGHVYHFRSSSLSAEPRLIVELVIANSKGGNELLIEQALSSLGTAAQDYLQTQQQLSWQRKESMWNELQTMLPALNSGMRMAEVAYVIANEGRKFVGCDRLSVARLFDARAELLAVSGVAGIERRAKQVRNLEALVATVSKSRQPLRYPQDRNLPPQIDQALQTYIDSSQCRRLSVLLVMCDRGESIRDTTRQAECCAALILESFTDSSDAGSSLRTQWLMQQATFGLRHAFRLESLPLLRLSLQLQTIFRGYRARRWRILSGFCAAAVLLLLAAIVPANLDIQAKGTLQPLELRHVYAPANGEIVELRAEHQDRVRKGDALVVIHSRDSELKKEELLTQRGITQEKLRSIEAARLNDRKSSSVELSSTIDLSASERELAQMLASQDQQLAILNELIDSLTLTSPIDGSVISWNPSESLERRPVQQGQKLMSVAQRDGPGLVELRVLDEEIRFLQQAQQTSQLSVSFVIASDPGRMHSGVVRQIGTIAESQSGERASVRVAVVVAADEMENATPGATVNAKIHCGRAAIGYVWTRRLLDFLRLRLI